MLRSIKILLACAVFLFALAASSCIEVVEDTPDAPVSFVDKYDPSDTWLVYWYICGSDLESNYASASHDLQELINAKIPDNVSVLIQAGGTTRWQNAVVQSGQTNLFLYNSTGLHEIETMPDSDMGDSDTLASFLLYGRLNFEADHRVFIFWDHGGGSVFGLCQDERTNNTLSLNEVRDAFVSVYDANPENPPFEMVGFDTCLMGTYEMANTLYGLSRYMVASEEVEPGNGWEYTGLLTALGKNPAMGGDAFGKVICDTYFAGCETVMTEDTATLSVVDLSKMPALRKAYENFGIEALKLSAEDPRQFFSTFGRHAKRAENYGGNTREKGYFDMLDIGDLARRSQQLLPQTSNNLLSAISDAVVYKVRGVYRDRGTGLSAFYPYDGQAGMFNMYAKIKSAPLPQKYLYYHLLSGELPLDAEVLLNTEIVQEPVVSPEDRNKIFTVEDLENTPIQIDSKNNAYVQLTKEQTEILSNVVCNLAYVDEENDLILYVGSDANIELDWEKGFFRDHFNGTWPMLDGHPVYVEVTANDDNYNLYSIPIKLNGTRANLEVAYDRKKSTYKILGVRGVSGHGMSDKNLIKLKAGDEITTLHYGMSISGDDKDFTEVAVETFRIGDGPRFEVEEIADGEYLYCFEFITPDNESASSEFINFTIKDGKIYTSRVE